MVEGGIHRPRDGDEAAYTIASTASGYTKQSENIEREQKAFNEGLALGKEAVEKCLADQEKGARVSPLVRARVSATSLSGARMLD